MWILISILILIILLVVFFIMLYKNRKSGKKQEPDYYTFFIIGIVWLCAGVPLGTSSNNWGLSIIGIAFIILGLANKDKWKHHKRPCWKDLSKKEKRIKIWTIILLSIVVLVLAFYFLFRLYT